MPEQKTLHLILYNINIQVYMSMNLNLSMVIVNNCIFIFKEKTNVKRNATRLGPRRTLRGNTTNVSKENATTDQ